MDSWFPYSSEQRPHNNASRQRPHHMGLTFPAEISIRPALQIDHRDERHRHEHPHASRTDHDQPGRLPLHPATPLPSVHPRSRYRPVEPRLQLPDNPQSKRSVDWREYHRYAQPDDPIDGSQTRAGFLLPDRPPSTPEKQFERLVTNQAEYLVIKPLQESPSQLDHGSSLMLIEDRKSRELFVEKRRTAITRSSRERADAEINALWQIMHAGGSLHINAVFETFFHPHSTRSSTIMEYCDCGTLDDFIRRYIHERKSTPEGFAWHVLSSLASALCMCHYGINDATRRLMAPRDWPTMYHFDVQPSSIWLSSRGTTSTYPRVVLGGFSCVSRPADIESEESSSVLLQYGTSAWLPSEARHHRNSMAVLGKFTDIWQAGAVIKAMCRLIHDPDMVLVRAERPCGSQYSPTFNNIVSCCMNGDWSNRPSAVDLVLEISKETSRLGVGQVTGYI